MTEAYYLEDRIILEMSAQLHILTPFHMVLIAMVFYTEIIFQKDFQLEHKFQALI